MNKPKLSIADSVGLPNSTVRMPQLGFGVYQISTKKAAQACLWAFEAGYRHIDTAQLYRNEAEVGEAVKRSGVNRSEIFLTTKTGSVGKSEQETYQMVLNSVTKIAGGDGYVDLFLVHNPYGGDKVRKGIWLALERLYEEGKTRSIGVSNYEIEHIEEMKQYAKVWPPHVNQIELNPWHQQRKLQAYCKDHGIVLQAYSPLAQAVHMKDPTLTTVAEKYRKSAAQILIRYSLQKDWVPLPKSAREERIKANTDVYDFEISDEDMAALDTKG